MTRSRVSPVRAARDGVPARPDPMRAGVGGGVSSRTAGALAAETWLRGHGVTPPPTRWHVEIALDIVHERAPTEFDEHTATRFHLDIYTEEWGVYFCHAGRSSWIRVTDIAFVHGRDDFHLLDVTPALKDIGQLLGQLERTHRIQFQRKHASIRTNLAGVEPAIRSWVATF